MSEFIDYLVKNKVIADGSFSIVDVGARAGYQDSWDRYGDFVSIFGFEPDLQECQRVNEQSSLRNRKCFPNAISNADKSEIFYSARFPACSGLLKADIDYIRRYGFIDTLESTEECEIECISLDSWAVENSIQKIDFLKVDVEGAELSILKGADSLLENIIACDVETWIAPAHIEQADVGKLISYMHKKGFQTFDMELHRHKKTCLPESLHTFNESRGQLIWSQTLFIRDPVREIQRGSSFWTKENIVKSLMVFSKYNYLDSAIEVVIVAYDNGILDEKDRDDYLDVLTPCLSNGVKVCYVEYMAVRVLELLHFYIRVLDKDNFFPEGFLLNFKEELSVDVMCGLLGLYNFIDENSEIKSVDTWEKAFCERYFFNYKEYFSSFETLLSKGILNFDGERFQLEARR
ncbi:FkbM family methyltransferase [Marinomonas gallaica]|uniref:FkbM family methyltransferase n=1 Tax=Marinomonas gallaica TaxID=1806667 RepID=UPI003A95AF94